MAVTSFASGTQTTTVGTLHYLSSPNSAGVYELFVESTNLADGDVLEVFGLRRPATGVDPVVVLFQVFADAQSRPISGVGVGFMSEPISNALAESNAVRWAIRQTRGSSRSLRWEVLKHA